MALYMGRSRFGGGLLRMAMPATIDARMPTQRPAMNPTMNMVSHFLLLGDEKACRCHLGSQYDFFDSKIDLHRFTFDNLLVREGVCRGCIGKSRKCQRVLAQRRLWFHVTFAFGSMKGIRG
jgi:hypothetical protein